MRWHIHKELEVVNPNDFSYVHPGNLAHTTRPFNDLPRVPPPPSAKGQFTDIFFFLNMYRHLKKKAETKNN